MIISLFTHDAIQFEIRWKKNSVWNYKLILLLFSLVLLQIIISVLKIVIIVQIINTCHHISNVNLKIFFDTK